MFSGVKFLLDFFRVYTSLYSTVGIFMSGHEWLKASCKTEKLLRKLNGKKLLKALIFISEVYNLRRTNMSAVFGSYDRQLENTSSMSDVADVFRTHWYMYVGTILAGEYLWQNAGPRI